MRENKAVVFTLTLICILVSSCSNITSKAPSARPHFEIFDERALDIIDPTAELVQKAEGFKWAEGPLRIDDGNYWLFSDIPNNRIMKYSDEDGLTTFLSPSGATGLHENDSLQGSNALLLNNAGKLVILQHGDRRVVTMNAPLSAPKPVFEVIADRFANKRFNSPNDGTFHSNGTLYFTDPPYGLNGGMDSAAKALDFQGIYSISPDGKVMLLDDSLTYPNGIAFTRNESEIVVAVSDPAAPKWVIFDVSIDGTLENKRVFFDPSALKLTSQDKGLPDGLKRHSSGAIFATGPGGVYLFSEDGDLLAKIKVDRATANVALSADEKTLLLTSHDVVYEMKLK